MAPRPTFFISSTIYDFRDLRSAIKFSLEQRGCRVLASEYNDFGGQLDSNSYDTCLKNIEQADFFVLLIGTRVGGWFDEPNRVSITQQEYRAAYKLHQAGRLRLVNLVRQEVWQLKEDRRALEQFLKNGEEKRERAAEIANFPTKQVGDPGWIIQFINEVGRNAEMSQGLKPTGNWIYQFRDFRDVNDVLQPLSFLGHTAEEAAYRKALQTELLHVVSRLVLKHDEKIIDFEHVLREKIARTPITVEIRDRGLVSVDLSSWSEFSSALFQLLGVRLEPVVLDTALSSTAFLEYDPALGNYRTGKAYDALFLLRALPGIVWVEWSSSQSCGVEVEGSKVEVDGIAKPLPVAEAAG